MEHSSFVTRSTPVWQFFGWSFMLSWLIWVPLALAHYNLGPDPGKRASKRPGAAAGGAHAGSRCYGPYIAQRWEN
jgi:hypothetical protein